MDITEAKERITRAMQYIGEMECAVAELEAQLRDLRDRRKELVRLIEAHGEIVESSKLVALLEGRITHVAVLASWHDPAILPREKWTTGMPRLLAVAWGTSGLVFDLNRYNNGNGEWEQVIPCESEAEARAALSDQLRAYEAPGMNDIERFRKLGVEIPPEVEGPAKVREAEQRRKALAETRGKLLRIEQELAEVER